MPVYGSTEGSPPSTQRRRALFAGAVTSCLGLSGVYLGMDDGFGARASQAEDTGETLVDWRKVVVWLAMAVTGVVLWGLAGIALFEALRHL
jgi:hypothetical protein